jgi:hypothetical protein
MGQLLRGISTAKAELAQYQLNLHVACRVGSSGQCWKALHYSSTIGADVAADLTRVGRPPALVDDLWNHTWSTVLALQTVAARSCHLGPPLENCSDAVDRTILALSQALARWDVYVAWK